MATLEHYDGPAAYRGDQLEVELPNDAQFALVQGWNHLMGSAFARP